MKWNDKINQIQSLALHWKIKSCNFNSIVDCLTAWTWTLRCDLSKMAIFQVMHLKYSFHILIQQSAANFVAKRPINFNDCTVEVWFNHLSIITIGHNGCTCMPLEHIPLVSQIFCITSLTARFMGPIWGPAGADRTQVGSMLAPWTLPSGMW